MPMQSKAQRRYLWAKKPKIAREFENKTPEGKVLPEKVASLSDLYLSKQAAGLWDVAKGLGTVAKGIVKEPVGLSQKARMLGQSAKGHFGLLGAGQKAGLIAGGAGLAGFGAGRATS